MPRQPEPTCFCIFNIVFIFHSKENAADGWRETGSECQIQKFSSKLKTLAVMNMDKGVKMWMIE